jgi:hypothetical protein
MRARSWRPTSIGAAGAALIPLDDRELLLPGSEELIGKWTQRVARPAVEHEHDRIPTTVAAPAPLVMPSLNDVDDDGGVIAVTECRDGNTARAG